MQIRKRDHETEPYDHTLYISEAEAQALYEELDGHEYVETQETLTALKTLLTQTR